MYARYRALAKEFLAFEKGWFGRWRDTCTHTAMQHTKQSILRKDAATGEPACLPSKHSPSLHPSPHPSGPPAWLPPHPPALSPACLSACPPGRVVVNFHADLTSLIRETRYLDKMGFAVPELALQLALQEPKYDAWLEQLERMLAHYYQVGGCGCGLVVGGQWAGGGRAVGWWSGAHPGLMQAGGPPTAPRPAAARAGDGAAERRGAAAAVRQAGPPGALPGPGPHLAQLEQPGHPGLCGRLRARHQGVPGRGQPGGQAGGGGLLRAACSWCSGRPAAGAVGGWAGSWAGGRAGRPR